MKKILLILALISIGASFAMAPPPPNWNFNIKNGTGCDYEYLIKFIDTNNNIIQHTGSVPQYGSDAISVPADYSFYQLRVYDGAGLGNDANVNTSTTLDYVGDCNGNQPHTVSTNSPFIDAGIS